MRVLLIGATGVLGSRLFKDLGNTGFEAIGTYCSSRSEGLYCLDLRDKGNIASLVDFYDPDVVILSGGITNVDACEEDPKLAKEVNLLGVNEVIEVIKKRGKKLVFLSTDYIFNGEKGPYREKDEPAPLNVYGRTKLDAENNIRAKLSDYLIVRTAQLYGVEEKRKNFTLKIIDNIRNKKKVYAAEDFYCTPTYVGELSSGIIGLIKAKKRGIYHIAGNDLINRVEFVQRITEVFNLDNDMIVKVRLNDLGLKAVRPKRAGLKNEKIKNELDSHIMGCVEGLRSLRSDLENTRMEINHDA